jgi:hypothetical protein
MTVIAVTGTYGAERLSAADVVAPALSAIHVEAEPAAVLVVATDLADFRR